MKKDRPHVKGAGQPTKWTGLNKTGRDPAERLRNKSEAELAAQNRKETAQALRTTDREKIARQIRAELERSFRAEIEVLKMQLTAKLLNPAHLLSEFTARATELLEGRGDGPAPPHQQISSAVRQAVLEALQTRKTHLAQLIELDRFLRAGTTRKLTAERVSSWMTQAGMQRIDTPENLEFFNLQGDDDGEFVVVISSAYVDTMTGQVIQPGQVKFVTDCSRQNGRKAVRRTDLHENVAADQE
jgi:hypothetical protein